MMRRLVLGMVAVAVAVAVAAGCAGGGGGGLTCKGSPSGGCDLVVASASDCPFVDDICVHAGCFASYQCCFCGSDGWTIEYLDCPLCDAGVTTGDGGADGGGDGGGDASPDAGGDGGGADASPDAH